MTGKTRCAGYVKPMKELPRITAVSREDQMRHILDFADEHGFSPDIVYMEDSADSAAEYRRLIEDAVHREFDVLIVDSVYCFGQALFPAADLIENALMPAGFRVFVVSDGMDSECSGFIKYLSYCKGCMRSSLAAVSQQKNRALGIRSRRAKKRPAPEFCRDLRWYEARQRELFREMLGMPENFDELENEMKVCRMAIRRLRV